MKVGIIGSGYVGLVTGACFAELGHTVICVDNDLKKIATLKSGKSPIYEPGLDELIAKNLKKGLLQFTHDIKLAVKKCEVLFICVNTPPKENGEADLSYVENVARQIAGNLTEYRLIVEKSTVPVQTGEWIYKTIKGHQIPNSLFDVASNPEFLREGSAVHDLLNPDRIILGVANPKSEKILRKLYEPIKNTKVVVTDLKSAELIKHASNSFLATKIAFINVVSRICDAVGADVERVAEGMGLDPRIGPSFLKAGIGFGGFCFPKDLSAFLRMAEKIGINFDILKEVLVSNDVQKKYFVKKIENVIWNFRNKVVGVWGLSFKPNTDDIRYAPSIDIIEALQREGVKIQAYDPQAMERAREIMPNVKFVKTPYDAVRGADALALLTEWNEFNTVDFLKIKKIMRQPIIFDGRNMFNSKALIKMGFQYHAMGRGQDSFKKGALS